MLLLTLLLVSFNVVWGQIGGQNGLAKVCKPRDRALDLLFILDGSGSVSGNTWDTQISMVRRIINQLAIGKDKTRVALVQYSGYSKLEFDFEQFQTKAELLDAIERIRYLTGTTRTGRALSKAIETFKRFERPSAVDVARVIVLVSDGFSQDDAVAVAEQVRAEGIELLALGIGRNMNMEGLAAIAGDITKLFRNDSVDLFVDVFQRIAIGEVCEYAKGTKGLEIICGSDEVTFDALTIAPLKGHLYMQGNFESTGCSTSPTEDGKRLLLKVPLGSCGMERRYEPSSSSIVYASTVQLKYHPYVASKGDDVFYVQCEYPINGSLAQFASDGGDQSVDLPAGFPPPCSYSIHNGDREGCVVEEASIGDDVTHRWECNGDLFNNKYGFLVHTCYLVDEEHHEMLIIDEHGCSLDPSILATPSYRGNAAWAKASIVKFPDTKQVQFRCSVKSCLRESGECAEILPPPCTPAQRRKRDNYRQEMRRIAQKMYSDWSRLHKDQPVISQGSTEDIIDGAQRSGSPEELNLVSNVTVPEGTVINHVGTDSEPAEISAQDGPQDVASSQEVPFSSKEDEGIEGFSSVGLAGNRTDFDGNSTAAVIDQAASDLGRQSDGETVEIDENDQRKITPDFSSDVATESTESIDSGSGVETTIESEVTTQPITATAATEGFDSWLVDTELAESVEKAESHEGQEDVVPVNSDVETTEKLETESTTEQDPGESTAADAETVQDESSTFSTAENVEGSTPTSETILQTTTVLTFSTENSHPQSTFNEDQTTPTETPVTTEPQSEDRSFEESVQSLIEELMPELIQEPSPIPAPTDSKDTASFRIPQNETQTFPLETATTLATDFATNTLETTHSDGTASSQFSQTTQQPAESAEFKLSDRRAEVSAPQKPEIDIRRKPAKDSDIFSTLIFVADLADPEERKLRGERNFCEL